MERKVSSKACLLLLTGVLCYTQHARAQHYKTIKVKGFNADIVANGTTSDPKTTVTMTPYKGLDNVNFVLMAEDFNCLGYKPAYYLPANHILSSTTIPGLTYMLADYTQNNSLILHNSEGSLTFEEPVAADSIYISGTSGSGTSQVTFRVQYADGSAGSDTIVTMPDWFAGGYDVTIGARFEVDRNYFHVPYDVPGLYLIALNTISSRKISSVTIHSEGKGFCNILAVSAKAL